VGAQGSPWSSSGCALPMGLEKNVRRKEKKGKEKKRRGKE
jgi:hypothetical protein